MSYVKNTTNQDIGPITFDGFEFTLPANAVSALYTPAAEVFTKELFHSEVVDILKDGGAPLPPLISVDRDQWDGKTYATVTRFKIDHTRIPNRNDLIRLAQKYGVNRDRIDQFKNGVGEGEIPNDEIAAEINRLPVPEAVRIPEEVEVIKKK